MKKVSGLTIRRHLKKSKEFELTYRFYYADVDFSARLAFLMGAPINILEELDQDLQSYIAHTPLYRPFLYIVVPIIEEAYRNYVVKCSGRTIPQANLQSDSLFIDDGVLKYYERLTVYLKFIEGIETQEIKRICGDRNDFSFTLTQIFSKLRKAFQDVNLPAAE